jgi:hypothetical protein
VFLVCFRQFCLIFPYFDLRDDALDLHKDKKLKAKYKLCSPESTYACARDNNINSFIRIVNANVFAREAMRQLVSDLCKEVQVKLCASQVCTTLSDVTARAFFGPRKRTHRCFLQSRSGIGVLAPWVKSAYDRVLKTHKYDADRKKRQLCDLDVLIDAFDIPADRARQHSERCGVTSVAAISRRISFKPKVVGYDSDKGFLSMTMEVGQCVGAVPFPFNLPFISPSQPYGNPAALGSDCGLISLKASRNLCTLVQLWNANRIRKAKADHKAVKGAAGQLHITTKSCPGMSAKNRCVHAQGAHNRSYSNHKLAVMSVGVGQMRQIELMTSSQALGGVLMAAESFFDKRNLPEVAMDWFITAIADDTGKRATIRGPVQGLEDAWCLDVFAAMAGQTQEVVRAHLRTLHDKLRLNTQIRHCYIQVKAQKRSGDVKCDLGAWYKLNHTVSGHFNLCARYIEEVVEIAQGNPEKMDSKEWTHDLEEAVKVDAVGTTFAPRVQKALVKLFITPMTRQRRSDHVMHGIQYKGRLLSESPSHLHSIGHLVSNFIEEVIMRPETTLKLKPMPASYRCMSTNDRNKACREQVEEITGAVVMAALRRFQHGRYAAAVGIQKNVASLMIWVNKTVADEEQAMHRSLLPSTANYFTTKCVPIDPHSGGPYVFYGLDRIHNAPNFMEPSQVATRTNSVDYFKKGSVFAQTVVQGQFGFTPLFVPIEIDEITIHIPHPVWALGGTLTAYIRAMVSEQNLIAERLGFLRNVTQANLGRPLVLKGTQSVESFAGGGHGLDAAIYKSVEPYVFQLRQSYKLRSATLAWIEPSRIIQLYHAIVISAAPSLPYQPQSQSGEMGSSAIIQRIFTPLRILHRVLASVEGMQSPAFVKLALGLSSGLASGLSSQSGISSAHSSALSSAHSSAHSSALSSAQNLNPIFNALMSKSPESKPTNHITFLKAFARICKVMDTSIHKTTRDTKFTKALWLPILDRLVFGCEPTNDTTTHLVDALLGSSEDDRRWQISLARSIFNVTRSFGGGACAPSPSFGGGDSKERLGAHLFYNKP